MPDARTRPRIAVTRGDLSRAELERALDDPALAGCELVFVEGSLDDAVALARTKRVDALAGGAAPDDLAALAPHGDQGDRREHRGAAPPLVELLVRGATRVLVAATRASEVDTERAAALVAAAAQGLAREAGIARPRLALCAVDGADAHAVAARARALGANVVGPLPAEEAFADGSAHAVVAFTRDQARLGLALAGREATARLVLGLPFVRASDDPAERATRAASLRASVLLAARLAPLRGELVAAREEREDAEKRARLAALAVSARSAPTTDRCPYCRREFTFEEPGLACAGCQTPHHRACIHEHGRCTVHGCGATAVLRAGVKIPVARLAGDAASRIPFVARLGSESEEVLLVEPPIDDPSARPRNRELVIELASREVLRGAVLAGTLAVHAPKPFRIAGGTLHLRAALELRGAEERPRVQPIVHREAFFAGTAGRGLLSRLSTGVSSILGAGEEEQTLAIPAGVRRYPFAFRLRADHPATVKNQTRRVKGDLEIVTTSLEATLEATSGGGLQAACELLVR